MKIKFLFLLSFFSTLSAGYQISELVEKALLQSPAIKSANFSIKEKDRLVQAAKSKFMPSGTLSVSTGINPNNNIFYNFDRHQSQIKLAINQKIFDPAAIIENKVAKINKNIAHINVELESAKIRDEINTTFHKAWLEQERKDFIDQLWSTSKLDLNRDLKRANFGLLSKTQVSSSLAKFGENKKQVLKYSNSLSKSFSELEKAVGAPILENGCYPTLLFDDKNEEIGPRQFYINQALENRNEIALALKQIELEDKNSELAISGYLPSVSGLASFEGLKDHHSERKHNCRAHVGLSATWNFFDGAGHKFQYEAAQARKFKTEENLQLTKMRIGSQISALFDSVQEKQAELDCSNNRLAEQKKVFDKKTLESKLGLISKHEFERAKLDRLKAKFDWLESKVGLKNAQTQLTLGCWL